MSPSQPYGAMSAPRSRSGGAVSMVRKASSRPPGDDHLQHPGRLVGRVPERVPLAARLEDQVADVRDVLLARGVEPDPALEDQAELVLLGVPVQRRGDRVRGQQVLDHGEPATPVLRVDEEPVPTPVHRAECLVLASPGDPSSCHLDSVCRDGRGRHGYRFLERGVRMARWVATRSSPSTSGRAGRVSSARSVLLGCPRAEAEGVVRAALVHCLTDWSQVRRADDREAYVHRVLVETLRLGHPAVAGRQAGSDARPRAAAGSAGSRRTSASRWCSATTPDSTSAGGDRDVDCHGPGRVVLSWRPATPSRALRPPFGVPDERRRPPCWSGPPTRSSCWRPRSGRCWPRPTGASTPAEAHDRRRGARRASRPSALADAVTALRRPRSRGLARRHPARRDAVRRARPRRDRRTDRVGDRRHPLRPAGPRHRGARTPPRRDHLHRGRDPPTSAAS